MACPHLSSRNKDESLYRGSWYLWWRSDGKSVKPTQFESFYSCHTNYRTTRISVPLCFGGGRTEEPSWAESFLLSVFCCVSLNFQRCSTVTRGHACAQACSFETSQAAGIGRLGGSGHAGAQAAPAAHRTHFHAPGEAGRAEVARLSHGEQRHHTVWWHLPAVKNRTLCCHLGIKTAIHVFSKANDKVKLLNITSRRNTEKLMHCYLDNFCLHNYYTNPQFFRWPPLPTKPLPSSPRWFPQWIKAFSDLYLLFSLLNLMQTVIALTLHPKTHHNQDPSLSKICAVWDTLLIGPWE